MSQNLKFVLFGKPADLKKIETSVKEINSDKFCHLKRHKNLGIVFDQTFSRTDQVNALYKSLYFEIRRISHIRNYLSLDFTVTLMMSLVPFLKWIIAMQWHQFRFITKRQTHRGGAILSLVKRHCNRI